MPDILNRFEVPNRCQVAKWGIFSDVSILILGIEKMHEAKLLQSRVALHYSRGLAFKVFASDWGESCGHCCWLWQECAIRHLAEIRLWSRFESMWFAQEMQLCLLFMGSKLHAWFSFIEFDICCWMSMEKKRGYDKSITVKGRSAVQRGWSIGVFKLHLQNTRSK